MTNKQARSQRYHRSGPKPWPGSIQPTHYTLLGLHPSASSMEIRRAYRELSKRYHPDTTDLLEDDAKAKFQKLNEAYSILSNPDRRQIYDQTISTYRVITPPTEINYRNHSRPPKSRHSSATEAIAAENRPLSPGELFALLMMAISLIGCLGLAIAIALFRSDITL
ncbi:MAG: J domain-containing protein [Arthrospira sp. SH-MAG29]|nr:J domain-containing protein [Arthrospira sp. SH-MAG29]MBS0018385.1 J domain-containing protein [Arthrospira sp. SH-MAG29]